MNVQKQPTEGEILEQHPGPSTELTEAAVEGSLAIGLSRVEIDQQIATARRYPRKMTTVAQNVLSLATLDEETAEECMYALPRGGKPIQGASIRFAEIVKASYGNCRAAARVVHVDRVDKVVIAEGVFHDLETNTASRAEVRRRISDRNGKLYSDDMIIVTGNAACSIALRNAILGGVPKPLWRKAYDAVQHTIAGDVTTLSATRDKAVKAFANYGVTPGQVFQALGVGGVDDIKIEHIPVLRGMFATLKNGEATVEEMFSGTVASKAPKPPSPNQPNPGRATSAMPEGPGATEATPGPGPAKAGNASPAPSSTKPDPSERPEGAPPLLMDEPEACLKWIDKTLTAVTDPGQLATVWDEQIEPTLHGAFPPDAEVAQGIYRKHELRLGVD